MMKLLRYLLFPIVPIYYVITWVRNKLYDVGIKTSTSYDFPVICVGNLSVGGTGKTPMIEYLIRLLQDDYRIATLSRGYKRQTEGFIIADKTATAQSIGDEPFQFYEKFENIIVSVDANRVHGISELTKLQNSPQIILLDDAFQHRKVRAGLNIILTAFNELYVDDIVLPTGNLREPRQGADRADIIVVTKCPSDLTDQSKQAIVERLHPREHQHVFFGSIAYADVIKNKLNSMPLSSLVGRPFLLVTGIANPQPLVSHLKSQGLIFEHRLFKDHHDFTMAEIEHLKKNELIITTEKDMVRLQPHFTPGDAVFYLPIAMLLDTHTRFDQMIHEFVR